MVRPKPTTGTFQGQVAYVLLRPESALACVHRGASIESWNSRPEFGSTQISDYVIILSDHPPHEPNMTTFQLFISAGFPSVIVLAGILMHQIQTSAIRKDVRMLTVKVIELTDGISHLEAHIRSS